MKPNCPYSCDLNLKTHPEFRPCVRFDNYRRSSDSRTIPRFLCRRCGRTFSRATAHPAFGQKKRRLNERVRLLLASGVSQRRSAILLGTNPKTIARKFRFLAAEARVRNEFRRMRRRTELLREIQFDDLETSEHTKLKPLSVAIAVEPKSREILGFRVSRMPAKGRLARRAREKYGRRRDERARGWRGLMDDLRPIVAGDCAVLSDENPHYPRFVRRLGRGVRHRTTPGVRGCVTGQGELKRTGYDPLFALNHTCAMLRANLNRLFRRTWCTTKAISALVDHLDLYVDFHNSRLIRASTG